MNTEEVRIFSVVTEDAREAHRAALTMADVSMRGHVSVLNESDPVELFMGDDAACMKCGHINEAEYALAEAGAANV